MHPYNLERIGSAKPKTIWIQLPGSNLLEITNVWTDSKDATCDNRPIITAGNALKHRSKATDMAHLIMIHVTCLVPQSKQLVWYHSLNNWFGATV